MKPGPKELHDAKVTWIQAKYRELLNQTIAMPPASLFSDDSPSARTERRREKESPRSERARGREKDEKEARDRERRGERDREAIKVGYLGRLKSNPSAWVKNWFVLSGVNLNWYKSREVSFAAEEVLGDDHSSVCYRRRTARRG